MPRAVPPFSPSPVAIHHLQQPKSDRIVFYPVAAATAAFSVLLVFSFCLRKIHRRRTVPEDSKPPYQYSYSALRRATASFSPSRCLGQGGFGSVFLATLSNHHNVAVKIMDSVSLQSQREFQNELLFASKLDSSAVVSVLGFSSDTKRHRIALVYELMPNGNLQDALLHRKCPELMQWKQRFSIALHIVRGLEYLHGLDPPVIHGDIKPSNVLLDRNFSAKIADFGLARLKSEQKTEISCGLEAIKVELGEDNGSVAETESVATGYEEFKLGVDQFQPKFMEKGSVSEVNFESGKQLIGGKKSRRGWWKHNRAAAAAETGKVKDYVLEWIGSEINNGRTNCDRISSRATSSIGKKAKLGKKIKKDGKQFKWWASLDDDDDKEKKLKNQKRRPIREWCKDEHCGESAMKMTRKKKLPHLGMYNADVGEDRWHLDDDLYSESKRKRKRKGRRNWSRSSVGSEDWLWECDGEMPNNGGNTNCSTPSRRGTVCYIAPEYGCGAEISDKCDVYSFGVLMLVLIAGRRPLQVSDSPMSEFQRANLVSWAKHLARKGKLLDLVDKGVQCLDRVQALLCITVALLCLQKSSTLRPSMEEVAGMLTGATEPPQLPAEFLPSPPSRSRSKSRKKA